MEKNIRLRFIVIGLSLVLCVACRSPQKLVEAAVKRDSKVLASFVDTVRVTKSGDTTIIKLMPKMPQPSFIDRVMTRVEYVQKNRIEDKQNRREHRTKRVRYRQENRTARVESRGETKESIQESRDLRIMANVFNRNKRRELNTQTRQEGRSKRRWSSVFLFSFVFFTFGVIGGFQLSNKLNKRANGKNL